MEFLKSFTINSLRDSIRKLSKSIRKTEHFVISFAKFMLGKRWSMQQSSNPLLKTLVNPGESTLSGTRA